MSALEIPEDKQYFKIGQVAKLLGVESYVLRYWEGEFDLLSPEKTKSGQRIYQHEDIELLYTIRELLYTEMFTIAGARRQLQLREEGEGILVGDPVPVAQLEEGDSPEQGLPGEDAAQVQELQEQLRGLRQDYALRGERLEALEQAQAERGERARQLEQRCAELTRELQGRQERAEAIEESAEELEALARREEQARQEIEAGLEAAREQLEELRSEREDWRRKAQVLEAALAERQQEEDAFEQERAILQDHITQLEEDLELLVAEREKQSRAADEAWQHMARPLREEIERLKGDLVESRELNRKLRTEQASLSATVRGDHESRRMACEALRRELESLAVLAIAPERVLRGEYGGAES